MYVVKCKLVKLMNICGRYKWIVNDEQYTAPLFETYARVCDLLLREGCSIFLSL